MRIALSALTITALVFFGYTKPVQAQWNTSWNVNWNANTWPSGSWQWSCRNANVSGRRFTATCTANNGRWVTSSIDLNRCPSRLVGNSNGQLFCEGGGSGFSGNLPGGSWRRSCRNPSIQGYVVRASCSSGRGFTQTSFHMRNCPGWTLGNSGGRLFCESGASGPSWGNSGHFPGGSWVQSCGNANMSGNVFRAMCSTGQAHRSTTIDLRSCPSRLVGNRNGFLFCEG
jgi:hypothetical protein